MLHPEAKALLRLIEEKGLPPTHQLTPEQAREAYLQRRFYTQPEPPLVGSLRELAADGPAGPIPLRMYRPAGGPEAAILPVLVYFHGGGWVIGDLDTHDTLCRELCNASGCAVVAVHYRLAPEHPFPAGVDDSLAALRWVHAHAAALDLDPDRIAVGGDSAGGNLAAVVALANRGEGGVPLRFQLLIYPATDQRRKAPSHASNAQGYLLTADSVRYYHDHYLGRDGVHDRDWRASPLLHEDHAGLPPALVLTAGFDPLRDEGLQYADALASAGTPATCVCFERQIHGFVPMGRVLQEAGTAVRLCAAELRRALAPATGWA
jgi:acetyl esterase